MGTTQSIELALRGRGVGGEWVVIHFEMVRCLDLMLRNCEERIENVQQPEQEANKTDGSAYCDATNSREIIAQAH